ncbi:SGNH/GDSL hydrolase family protein [Kibdelosporangium philippinense]|uniref:SGNH/GDSL hydrolase family protein n=1 Tax=Kibdelosporangium philippinense TaxID=211113 RepID=A0ABS8ZWK0_9PSEU|nr:SGNH/GDSL hydrolase family protein [Kibdelosporangium philippinense]MCE7012110.1 SGNH/GDSL hydrolase family protein [Kibdelosporangium philippinense]
MNGYRFVAIGDSFTEGIGDPGPDGTFRGWADRFAEMLAERRGPISYANLAVRGLTARQVVQTQLDAAVALEPELVTAVAGMNDLIRPKLNFREFVADQEKMISTLGATGAQVITATLPTPGQGTPLPTPLRRALVKRLNLSNAFVRRIAAKHGALCLDLAAMLPPGTGGWSEDRLHPGPDGHRATAQACMGLLDGEPPRRLAVTEIVEVDPGEPTWREQLQWTRQFLVPWVKRRLRGESSAIGLVPKRSGYGTISS